VSAPPVKSGTKKKGTRLKFKLARTMSYRSLWANPIDEGDDEDDDESVSYRSLWANPNFIRFL
jgi:hypothetical protein